MATAFSIRVLWLVPLLALLVPWEADATCLTQAEAKKLVAETGKQITGKKLRGKKKKKASLDQLVQQVVLRGRNTQSRPEKNAWNRLYLALRPLASTTTTCSVDKRARDGVTAILRRLLANPKPPVFDIVAVQYLARQLASGEDDSWS